MIRAELVTGEVIELPNDCGCITHDGPHWLHEINLERALIADAVARWPEPQTPGQWLEHNYAIAYMAAQEQARLEHLLCELERRGIARLIYE